MGLVKPRPALGPWGFHSELNSGHQATQSLRTPSKFWGLKETHGSLNQDWAFPCSLNHLQSVLLCGIINFLGKVQLRKHPYPKTCLFHGFEDAVVIYWLLQNLVLQNMDFFPLCFEFISECII